MAGQVTCASLTSRQVKALCGHTKGKRPRPEAFRCAASRRQALLLSTGALQLLSGPASAVVDTGDWSSPGLASKEDPTSPPFFKTANGVKVQELTEGSGPAATVGDQVLLDYVLRRSNGYFIYGTIEGVSFQPRDVPVGPVALRLGAEDVIIGLADVVVGMKPGGRRRGLIPPAVGYTTDGLKPEPPTFGTRRQLASHKAEPLLFEIELLRVNGQGRE